MSSTHPEASDSPMALRLLNRLLQQKAAWGRRWPAEKGEVGLKLPRLIQGQGQDGEGLGQSAFWGQGLSHAFWAGRAGRREF